MTVKPFRGDGGDISTDRLREIADNPYGDEEKCWLAKRVLTLLDELERKEEQRANWFQMAQKLGSDLDAAEKLIAELENDGVRQQLANAEHQLHMAELVKRNLRASRKAQFRKRKAAELRIAELEAREVKLPERYEIEMQPLPAPNGEWYSRDDVLLSLASAGIRICRGE
ncbi:Uncharacterised protein [Enterobacter cloacae]|uniref:hypothetical protein n=1 Tax=Enterobacter cloacae TaxID=550 RepID=UPI00079BAF21|nr:hypothetical protein [Enterobacter cloacae]SAD44813.1 Uncharacterised protein [Enterobacter cloacae]